MTDLLIVEFFFAARHHVEVGYVADITEEHTAAIIRAEVRSVLK